MWILQRTCLKAASYLDGEVIPHVFPDPEAAQVGQPAASTRGSVIVEEPPNGIQHADQPEASEQQVKEQEDAGGCWGEKEVFKEKPDWEGLKSPQGLFSGSVCACSRGFSAQQS